MDRSGVERLADETPQPGVVGWIDTEDRSARLELVEFLGACSGVDGLSYQNDELRQAFRAADVDGNGILDINEFASLVDALDLRSHFPKILEAKKQRDAGKWLMARRTMTSSVKY